MGSTLGLSCLLPISQAFPGVHALHKHVHTLHAPAFGITGAQAWLAHACWLHPLGWLWLFSTRFPGGGGCLCEPAEGRWLERLWLEPGRRGGQEEGKAFQTEGTN